MRLWLALLLVPLAGCINTAEEPVAEPEIWGTCPQYVSGPSTTIERLVETNTTWLIDFNQTHQGNYPLDLYEIQVSTDARMEFRFFAGDKQVGATIYEPERDTRPFLVVNGEQSAAVYLSALHQGTDPAPGPLFVKAHGDGMVEMHATAWFRVCGQ